jgi:hypothetical protein
MNAKTKILHTFVIIVAIVASLFALSIASAAIGLTSTKLTSSAIDISYYSNISYSIPNQPMSLWGYSSTPDAGNVFLEVTMTIKNNGCSINFPQPYPSLFEVVANNVHYTYDATSTAAIGTMVPDNLFGLSNGETYTETIVFQVPSTITSFTMHWMQSGFVPFNVNWIAITN